MSLTAKAYAKINLFLDVVGKRSDGYHELDTVMQSVSLYDEVTVELCSCATDVIYSDGYSNKHDVVYTACNSFFEAAGLDLGARVHIKKNIPTVAGLGGASADAAAVIALLNILTKQDLSKEQLKKIALKCGADVPFCLVGGTCRAKGVGEELSSLNAPKMYYVLLKNGDKLSTADMFRRLDDTEKAYSGDCDGLVSALAVNDVGEACLRLHNAFSACYDIDGISMPLCRFNPLQIFLSGSGPTVVAVFPNKNSATNAVATLNENGFDAYYAESMECGIEIV